MPGPNIACFSRRRFFALLAATPFLEGWAGAAPPAAAPDSIPAPPRDGADVLQAQGVRLLRRGLRFERAGEYLALAAEKEPRNPAHPLALGCAYASRAASLAHAAGFANLLTEERAGFEEKVRDWEQVRDEMSAENLLYDAAEYEKGRPTLPPLREFRIKDTNQPYRLTPEQAEKRLNELGAKALAAWGKGVELSTSPEQKARAYYTQGWGMRVLRAYLVMPEYEGVPGLSFEIKDLPTQAEIQDAFEQAVTAEPGNALYWQAKADALEPGDAANAAYRKALERKPRDAANLWYLLYSRVAADAAAAAGAKSAPSEKWAVALDCLKRASVRDKGNAWPLYEEAAVLFRYAPYSVTGPSGNRNVPETQKEAVRQAVRNDAAREKGRRAVDLIVDGNRATRFDAPRYTSSVPDLLAAAWHYRFPPSEEANFARVRELARSAAGYAQFMAEFEDKPEEAERAAWAAVGLGYRMIGDWAARDDLATGKTVIRTLVGIAVAGIGYQSVDKVYATPGKAEKRAAAQAEQDAFKRRVADYGITTNDLLRRSELDYY